MLVRQLITMAMKWHLRSNLLKALSTPLVNIYYHITCILQFTFFPNIQCIIFVHPYTNIQLNKTHNLLVIKKKKFACTLNIFAF